VRTSKQHADVLRPAPAGRSAEPDPAAAGGELTDLLGRHVLEPAAQRVCRRFGLLPAAGADPAAGLPRSYLARDAGVELAADGLGTVTAVFLHFHGDDGFTSYRGAIPGVGGAVASRSALWAELGRPASSDDAYSDRFLGDFGPSDRWILPELVLRARYGLDGESLYRITLTPISA
jgi:hypothetical protein